MIETKLNFVNISPFFFTENGDGVLSESFSIAANGTLNFYPVSKKKEGMYKCEANNDIGSVLEKVVTLIVHGRNQNLM